MKPIVRELLAGAGASGFLVGLALLSNLSFGPLLVLSAAVYFGIRLAIPDPGENEVARGFTRDQLEATVAEIRSQAARFDSVASRLKKPVAERIRHIAQTTRDMISHLERDPANLALASELLELHLPKALRIVESYALLSEQPYLDQSARSRLDEAHKTIAMIEKAFEAQHARMLQSDVMAFDIDRRVYEELLRLDGQFEEVGVAAEPAVADAGPGDSTTPLPPLPPSSASRS